MAGISISALMEQRRRALEREEEQLRVREELLSADLTSHSVTTTLHASVAESGESVNEQGTSDRSGLTVTEIHEGREALRKKLVTTKERMLEETTKDIQLKWMSAVGTTINFYEQREFSGEELEEYYQIVLTKPELLQSEDSPHNLRLHIQFTKWVKEERVKKLLAEVTGSHSYQDEVNKVLGVVEDTINETDKVEVSFVNVLNFD